MLNKPKYISPREAKAEREAAHAQSIDAQIEMGFQIGERVRVRDSPDMPFLQGVVQKIRHDGMTGFDTSSGRCSVQLEDGRGPFSIKPGNLVQEVKAKKEKSNSNKTKKKKKKK